MLREALIGTAAGAVGTVALNAVTYGDMVVRGRPSSSVPADLHGGLAGKVGIDLSAEDEGPRAARRREPPKRVGGAVEVRRGLRVGTAYGLVRVGLGDVSNLRAGLVLGLAAMPAARFRPRL